MEQWCPLVLIVAILTPIIGSDGGITRSASKCFADEENTLTLRCDRGYMVRIVKSFYGYNHLNQCSYMDGDCRLEEKEHYPCLGKQMCTINLPTGDQGKRTKCGPGYQRSNYFQADYECIKDTDVMDICSGNTVTAQKGYLKSPNYPWNYHKNLDCTVTLPPRPKQTWKITALDFYLNGSSSKGCDDKLHIKALKQLTLCGTRWNEELFRTWSSNLEVEIQFTTDSDDHLKGFWLSYEAVPLLPTSTIKTSTTTFTTTNQGSSVTQTKVKVKSKNWFPAPAAAIIGGVIGGLLLILVILVILLVIKWMRENKNLNKSTNRSGTSSQNIQNNAVSRENTFTTEIADFSVV